MRTPAVLLMACAMLLVVAGLAPTASANGSSPEDAHARGMAYLATQGGEGPYPSGLAPYAVEAAHAAGLDVATWPTPSRTALSAVAVPAADAPLLQVVRPAYAAALAGRLRDWQGEDLEARLRAGFDGSQFGDPALLNDDLYALLALVAGGATSADPQVAKSVSYLAAHQNPDGGWGYAAGGASGTDLTAMVLLLSDRLGSTGQATASAATAKAEAYLSSARVDGEGFAESPGGASNCDSTAWALRVDRTGQWTDAWPWLLDLQSASGGFSYQAGGSANPLCTAEAVTALGDALQGRAAAPDLPEDKGRQAPGGSFPLLGTGLLGALAFRRN